MGEDLSAIVKLDDKSYARLEMHGRELIDAIETALKLGGGTGIVYALCEIAKNTPAQNKQRLADHAEAQKTMDEAIASGLSVKEAAQKGASRYRTLPPTEYSMAALELVRRIDAGDFGKVAKSRLDSYKRSEEQIRGAYAILANRSK